MPSLGYRILLANSNPATIMTDTVMADAISDGTDAFIPAVMEHSVKSLQSCHAGIK